MRTGRMWGNEVADLTQPVVVWTLCKPYLMCIPPQPPLLMLRWDISKESGTAEPKLTFYRNYTHLVLLGSSRVCALHRSSLHGQCQLHTLWEVWGACLGDLESTEICFLYRDLVTESLNHLGLKRPLNRRNAAELFPLYKLGPYSGLSKSERGQSRSSEQRNVAGYWNENEGLIPLSPACLLINIEIAAKFQNSNLWYMPFLVIL